MNKLQELDQKIEFLKKQRTRLASENAAAERTKRTRQMVVIGGHVAANMPGIFEQIKAALTRPQDRELFGLDPLPAPTGSESRFSQ